MVDYLLYILYSQVFICILWRTGADREGMSRSPGYIYIYIYIYIYMDPVGLDQVHSSGLGVMP